MEEKWIIQHIFDGDYGCEELSCNEKVKVSVTLINSSGEKRFVTVEDDWLTENELNEGSFWPADGRLS